MNNINNNNNIQEVILSEILRLGNEVNDIKQLVVSLQSQFINQFAPPLPNENSEVDPEGGQLDSIGNLFQTSKNDEHY
jgi:hypothetical protein